MHIYLKSSHKNFTSKLYKNSLIHLDLSSLQGDKYGSSCIHPRADTQSALFVEDALPFPWFAFGFFFFFVKNQVSIGVWVYFWVFDSIPLISIPRPWGFVLFCFVLFFYHYCSVVQLEFRDGDSTRGSFIVENSFQYHRSFVIPDEFENCSF